MSDIQLFKVTIDNITVEVPAGTSILEAARKIGGDVAPPAMCFYTKLKGSGGKCRTCLVEVSKGSEKDPRPMPKLVASCRTGVMDGMEVLKNLWENNMTKKIPVIVLTNAGDLNNMDKAKFYSTYKFFIKSNVAPEEILQAVKEALNTSVDQVL